MSAVLKTKVDGVVLPIGANYTKFVSLAGTEEPLENINEDFLAQVREGVYDKVVEIVGDGSSAPAKKSAAKPAFDPSGETVANVIKYLKKAKKADEIERVQALEAASDRDSVQIANFGKDASEPEDQEPATADAGVITGQAEPGPDSSAEADSGATG